MSDMETRIVVGAQRLFRRLGFHTIEIVRGGQTFTGLSSQSGPAVVFALGDLVEEIMDVAEGPADKIADELLAERRRQVSVHGHDRQHDDAVNRHGEIGDAAAAYAISSEKHSFWCRHGANLWPWGGSAERGERRRDLVKAGALIIAEIERLDRMRAVR